MVNGQTTNSIGMEFVPIRPGVFFMGMTDPSLKDSFPECYPPHPVELSGARAMSARLVTTQQWIEVMGGRWCVSAAADPLLPVTGISWHEAVEFCEQLSALQMEKDAERVYRLPTEAEWERMCRAGSDGLFGEGVTEANLNEYAWFVGSWPDDMRSDARQRKALLRRRGLAVGTRKPNQWGMYDLHGNVFEWCLDTDDPSLCAFLNGKRTLNPVHLAYAKRRASHAVVRGGYFASSAIECGCAVRFPFGRSRTSRDGHLGFRVVLDDVSVPLSPVVPQSQHAATQPLRSSESAGG